MIFEGEKPEPATALATVLATLSTNRAHKQPRKVPSSYSLPQALSYLLMDASYDQSGKAGMAVIAYSHLGQLQWVHMTHATSTSALQAEALGVLRAMEVIEPTDTPPPTVLMSDSMTLAQILQSENIQLVPEWRAQDTIEECIRRKRTCQGGISFRHVYREHLQGPHNLANYARRTGATFTGLPCSQFLPSMAVYEHLPGIFILSRTV